MRTRRACGLATLLVAGLVSGCTSSGSGGSGSGSATPPSVTPSVSGSTTQSAPPSGATGTSGVSGSSAAPTSSRPSEPSGGPVPTSFTPTSATFVSADSGWVLGTAPCSSEPCTSIVRTSDGGRSWVGIPAPRATLGGPGGSVDGQVSVLRFADTSDGWAGVDQLYSTHDGGSTWHEQSVGPHGSAVTAIQTGGGYVYVTVGCPIDGTGSCTLSSSVYASTIGSDRWTRVATGLGKATGYSGLTVHGDTWFVPTQNGIFRGTGTGAAQRLPNPCPVDEASAHPTPTLAIADNTHLDAVCLSQGAAGSASYQLYGTTDGAHSWRAAGHSRRGPSDLSGAADNTQGVLLLSSASGDSEILRTTNDGSSFTTALTSTSGGGREWADLGFTTATQAFVVLPNAAMYLSRDAGASFATVQF